jgi:hypothetical protein
MSRQRLTIGTFGDIGFQPTVSGRIRARARYRDWDGRTRLVEATGATQKSAEHALKAKLADRSLFQPSSSALGPDSSFSQLVSYWLEDLDLEGRLSQTTRLLYERLHVSTLGDQFEGLELARDRPHVGANLVVDHGRCSSWQRSP